MSATINIRVKDYERKAVMVAGVTLLGSPLMKMRRESEEVPMETWRREKEAINPRRTESILGILYSPTRNSLGKRYIVSEVTSFCRGFRVKPTNRAVTTALLDQCDVRISQHLQVGDQRLGAFNAVLASLQYTVYGQRPERERVRSPSRPLSSLALGTRIPGYPHDSLYP